MREVLDDTIAFYSENPKERRSINSEGGTKSCYYWSPKGQRCAVGRLFKSTVRKKQLAEYEGNCATNIPKLFFKKKFQFLADDSFLDDVQELHDDSSFWDDNGINAYGLDRAQSIRNEYGLN